MAWKSHRTLTATLGSYARNGLFEICDDVRIFFQEQSDEDRRLAARFGVPCLGTADNVGIGIGFQRLAETARYDSVLLLEHDWHLVEPREVATRRLAAGLELLDAGVHCVRYRHRVKYGEPHFSIARYKGKELSYYDDWIELNHPHLLDAVHWTRDPDKLWPDKISKAGEFYRTTSRYGNWTNNPCVYRTSFYLDAVRRFAGSGIDLERNISHWWARQGFAVAQGEGLFRHTDPEKYGNRYVRKIRKVLRTAAAGWQRPK